MSFYQCSEALKAMLIRILLVVAGLAIAAPAWAQPYENAALGYWATTGCPGTPADATCFKWYDTTGAGIPVVTVPQAAPTTDASSTIVTGGTFQQIAASSTSRKSLEFTNVCGVAANCTATSNNCWVYFGAFGSATKANSVQIVAGDSYLRSAGTIPSDAIAATCDGTGDHYALKVQ